MIIILAGLEEYSLVQITGNGLLKVIPIFQNCWQNVLVKISGCETLLCFPKLIFTALLLKILDSEIDGKT